MGNWLPLLCGEGIFGLFFTCCKPQILFLLRLQCQGKWQEIQISFLFFFFLVYTDYFLVIFSNNVLIEKYELKLDLTSQKTKMERNRAPLRELFSVLACYLN